MEENAKKSDSTYKKKCSRICIAIAFVVYCIALMLALLCYFKEPSVTGGAGEADETPENLKCGISEGKIPEFAPNGTIPPLNFVPWYVALKVRDVRSPRCGGTILSEEWVLTAKSCFNCHDVIGKFDCLIVVAGSQESLENSHGTIHSVIYVVEYGNKSVIDHNDIALLKVSPKFKFRSKNLKGNKRGIAPVCLPKDSEIITEMKAVASGFGVIDEFYPVYPPYLLTNEVNMYTLEYCANTAREDNSTAEERRQYQICAGLREHRKSGCFGDTGGPLTVVRRDRTTLIGVAPAVAHTGCSQFIYYMNVANLYSWINGVIST